MSNQNTDITDHLRSMGCTQDRHGNFIGQLGTMEVKFKMAKLSVQVFARKPKKEGHPSNPWMKQLSCYRKNVILHEGALILTDMLEPNRILSFKHKA